MSGFQRKKAKSFPFIKGATNMLCAIKGVIFFRV